MQSESEVRKNEEGEKRMEGMEGYTAGQDVVQLGTQLETAKPYLRLGQAGCATPSTLAICLSRGVDPTARVTMDNMSGCWIVMSGSCQGLSGSQYGDVPESPIFFVFLFLFCRQRGIFYRS